MNSQSPSNPDAPGWQELAEAKGQTIALYASLLADCSEFAGCRCAPCAHRNSRQRHCHGY